MSREESRGVRSPGLAVADSVLLEKADWRKFAMRFVGTCQHVEVLTESDFDAGAADRSARSP
jgi:hypothetical protein